MLESISNSSNAISYNPLLGDIDRLKKDVFSHIYEKTVDIVHRKENGQFFTHKEIVSFILNSLPIKKNSTILDPTCGAAAFLVGAIQKGHAVDLLYGVDIDPLAIRLANECISKTGQTLFPQILQADAINSLSLDSFPNIKQKGGFDFIVGNPPFMPCTKFQKDKYEEFLSGPANSATLVLANSLSLLKENGYLAFVLPKNILRVDSFAALRYFIAQHTEVVSIYDIDHYFKDVRCDQIILILRKKKPSLEHDVKIQIINKNSSFDKPTTYIISQNELSQYGFFSVFSDKNIHSLASKLLHNYKTLLETDVNIFRGISLTDISFETKGKNSFIRGKSLSRYSLKNILSGNILSSSSAAISKINRLNVEKVVIQNLCSKEGGICGTIAPANILTLDTVTNLTSNTIDLKYLLALITSKLANFFITQVLFLNSNFTMHADKSYIEKLPFVQPSSENLKQIQVYIEQLMNFSDKYSKEFFEVYNRLNDLIFDIYGLTPSDISIIESTLEKTMSRRSYGN